MYKGVKRIYYNSFTKMFAIVLLILVCSSFATHSPRTEESRIIGGHPAGIGEFSYQVSLRFRNGQHFCGGSIINSGWILTAAHCVRSLEPKDLIVVVGTNYLNVGGVSYYVARIISHGSFNVTNMVNDIAVLRINGTILGAPLAASIIGLANSTTPDGSNLVLSGWGLTESNYLPNALQYITLRSISVAKCQAELKGYPIFDTNLCTLMPYGQGTCKGDDGGPLVLNGNEQHGIASWGIPCAKGRPDVFTSVFAYRSWIKSVTGV